MKTLNYYAFFAMAQLFAVGICNAQNIKTAPASVAVDGSAKEWATFTPYASGMGKMEYVISNDKDNLYLVVKTADVMQQNNILNSGLSFSVDVKDRKRTTYTITYPTKTGNDQGGLTLTNEQILTAIETARQKKIIAEGFKDIKNEKIDFSNTYNIQTAMGYDADGNLVYEEAIPLALFNAGEFADKEWAFNIKINSSIRSDGGGSGSYRVTESMGATGSSPAVNARSSSGRSSTHNEIPQSSLSNNAPFRVIDVWVRSPLAKP